MSRTATLTSFPFQPRPALRSASEAYDLLIQHLHPKSKQSGLTEVQQFDIFEAAGGFNFDDVREAGEALTMQLADRVEAMLAH